jgi:hypothetical protein
VLKTVVCTAWPQVRYHFVSEEELERQRAQFRNGQLAIKIEEQSFSMKCGRAGSLPCSPALQADNCSTRKAPFCDGPNIRS